MGDIAKYFSAREFKCKCGRPECDAAAPQARLLRKLDALREAWGRPLLLVSGSRCEAHNAAVGGATGSQHVKGLAVDLFFSDEEEKMELVRLAARLKFGGVGWGVAGNGKVHLDVRLRMAGSGPATWRYS